MRVLLTIGLLVNFSIVLCYGQKHPTSDKPGCCGEKTANPYTYNPEESKVFLQLYLTNKVSEQGAFYYGKYDIWKEQKDNPLFGLDYIIPPGSLPIDQGVFLDQTEVSNLDYQEFLFYISKDSGAYQDKPYLPKMDNKYFNKYFLNPEFYYYPVIGITYKNAQDYCEWRAKQINVGLGEMLENQVKKYEFKGRLPKLAEWQKGAGDAASAVRSETHTLNSKSHELFAADIIEFRFATTTILDKKSFAGFNKNFSTHKELGLEIPLYVYSFEANDQGFYNLYGNVKELVEGGHSVGGSFMTDFSADELFSKDEVQAYRTDVGFRCLTEITRKK